MAVETGSAASWLAALLAPMTVDEFLSIHWRRRHLFCRGSAGRFSELLTWTEINRILEHHWRSPFRFRLARQGRDLEPSSYVDLEGVTPRVRARDVIEHLRGGATLSFDAIDEVHEPLARLAESFEQYFRGGTKINIYAGWRALHGLDLHRDDQEIFILQLDGPKRWLLYGDSVDGVDPGELRRSSIPPAGAVLDEVLQPGDLLYIPKGCYHVAIPMDEPVVHLTLSIKYPRTKDLARWMVERLGASGLADEDVPLLAGADERRRYSDAVRQALMEGLQPDLVEQFYAERGPNFKPRPSFSLPWAATPGLLPPGRTFQIRLAVDAHLLATSGQSGPLEFQLGARRFRFPRGMQWILERLDTQAPLPAGQLIDELAPRLDEDMVRLLLAMLVKENLIAITD
jgi:ribosomal protein L16 Arg81 hydroxylase